MSFLLLCVVGAVASAGDQTGGRKASAAADVSGAKPAAGGLAAADKVAADKAAEEKAAAAKAAKDKATAAKAAAAKAAKDKATAAKAAAAKAAKDKAAANRRVAMPDLVGLKLNIANDAWSNIGLTNVMVCRTPGGDTPFWYSHWRVIGQSVPAGKKIKVGAEVCLDAMKDSDM